MTAGVLGLVAMVVGCNSGGGGGLGVAPKAVTVGVPGVTLTRVTIYQAVERELMVGGQPPADEGVELVAGREAMVRLFYATDGSYDGKPVIGRVTVDNGAPIDVEVTLGAASAQNQMGTTVNIRIPAERVTESLAFSAALVRDTVATFPTAPVNNAAARWPADGSTTTLAVTGPKNILRVVLVPFQYNYDRSGRLPDMSAPTVEKYRQRFFQLYPVSDVQVTVHDPVPWSGQLLSDGTGWGGVARELFDIRQLDGSEPDVYYYGVFNPASSYQRFCGRGCLLGVTLLNNDPEDVGNPDLRQAIGVGYLETAMGTSAHEIGHAHGLLHANCGQGLDPNSIDVEYPFERGSIGVWGYDLVANRLIAPQTYTDIMSYCDQQWISDYHYRKLLNRGRNVNLPRWSQGSDGTFRHEGVATAATERVLTDVVSVDGEGVAWLGTRPLRAASRGGERVMVRTTDESGASVEVAGRYYRWDHLPGGMLFVPRAEAMASAPVRADFTLAARPYAALRAATP